MSAPARLAPDAVSAPPQGVRTLLRAARRAVRLTLAAARATWTRNPPLPARVSSLLFVCKGNICRSPFAAVQADRVARESGRALTHASAGIRPSQAGACPDDAVAAAATYGHDLRTWRPVLLDDALMASHDVVVVMETGQFRELRRRWPQHRGKIVLLSLFGPPAADAWARLNIADPFGKPRPAFEACYERIDLALRDLFTQLPAAAGATDRG